jgi:tripartite-type tricarboxylate transporter receptor subunit TctC
MNIRNLGLAALASAMLVATAHAQAPADFYKGKKVDVLIGVGVGGKYDQHARLVAL